MDVFHQEVVVGEATPLDVRVLAVVFGGLKVYVTPVVVILGVALNVTGLVVFSRRGLGKHRPSVFVCAVLGSDTVFLASLALVFVTGKLPAFRQSDWCCMVTLFLNQSTGLLSLWCSVGLLCDRVIALRKPTVFQPSACVATLVVVFLAYIAVTISLHQTLLFGVVDLGGLFVCHPDPTYQRSWEVLAQVDTGVNFLFLHSCLLIVNIHNHATFVTRKVSSRQETETDTGGFRDADLELTKVSITLGYCFLGMTLPGHCLRFIANLVRFDGQEHLQRLYVWQQLLMYLYILRNVSVFPMSFFTSSLVRKALVCPRTNRRHALALELIGVDSDGENTQVLDVAVL